MLLVPTEGTGSSLINKEISKYSEILKSFCAWVSLSSLPNSNFFMFIRAVDRAESNDPDGVIHNPKGRKWDRVSVMNEIICKVPKML